MATHKPVMVDELWGELTLSAEEETKWNVIYTKPQCEKKLADYLKRRDIRYYLPLYESKKAYQHRKVVFTKPLFPGYVFSCFGLNNKLDILNCGYVVRFMKVPNQQELLNDLHWIYQGRMKQLDFEQSEWLKTGWQVEIISGPMQGMLGLVQSQTKLDEVNLQVNILQQSVKLKLNPSDVRVMNAYGNQ